MRVNSLSHFFFCPFPAYFPSQKPWNASKNLFPRKIFLWNMEASCALGMGWTQPAGSHPRRLPFESMYWPLTKNTELKW